MSDAKKRRLTIPEQNSQDLAEDFKGLLFDEGTADVILKVQDVQLPAHRIVLAARCAYFRAMLYGGMQESTAKEVQINDDFSPMVMRLLLGYIYTEQLDPVALDDAVPLMACADHYGMSKLREAMLRQIDEFLTVDTFFEVLSAATKHRQERLVAKCLAFVPKNALPLLMSEAFPQQDASTALKILQAEGMQDKSHLCFRAAFKWQEHWTKLLEEGSESQEAKEAAHYLNPAGGEMRRYIDGAIRSHMGQVCNPVPDSHVEAKPAFIVRKRHVEAVQRGFAAWFSDDCDYIKYIPVEPSTARTRFRVHRPSQDNGPYVSVNAGDDGCMVQLDEEGWLCTEKQYERHITWREGMVVDVVMQTTTSGDQKVSVLNGDVLLHSWTTSSKLSMQLGFTRRSTGEVYVECIS